ncbi:sulfur oxidation c-type cytochrome SoxA [Azospirillum sp. ST 5-10]|uniref:sulfur oxidation c-type cytochrome SoxA n=1 Tax=unclassified Azospirillum TaxID=2630922 RepID=UPI003F49FCF5
MNRASMGMAAFVAVAAFAAPAVHAQDKVQEGIDAYREALQDGNPAELYEMTGEELWTTPSGPKNASLERCDLGLGAGVVQGAYAHLPRYFADTDRVQDLESRLLTCMETLQGKDPKAYVAASFKDPAKEELTALSAYISGQSREVPVAVAPAHPKEKAMYELGKRLFFYQGGPYDFACATCHGQDGTRIRMQNLPYIPSAEGAAAGWTTWPAYRVSNGQMWSMQQRLNDCFRQQRFPEPVYASEATIALSMYIAANSNGAIMQTPGIKR